CSLQFDGGEVDGAASLLADIERRRTEYGDKDRTRQFWDVKTGLWERREAASGVDADSWTRCSTWHFDPYGQRSTTSRLSSPEKTQGAAESEEDALLSGSECYVCEARSGQTRKYCEQLYSAEAGSDLATGMTVLFL
ncbi:hypothetical protein HPB47_017429, partial [Ixodes persulcatus]